MNKWYLVKVKFIKEFTDGTLKKVSEPYLVSAMSFTDAEARIYKEVGEYVRGEFLVTAISVFSVEDLFHYDDAETWYKVKVTTVVEDADSGKEKRHSYNYLVTAHNTKEAHERVEESLRGLMFTLKIQSVVETKIVEVFPYEQPEAIGESPAEEVAEH